MSVIEAVRREREDLARVLKKHTGIRKIVEDLYPDSAHFIYELLQNAEDAHATYAQFVLTEESLAFEHDGRPFEPRDIEAITDIGEGTKAGDDDKIGRFGVGFKAVFAYSETPHIWSPTFSFKISELVLPDRLDRRPDLGNKTRFEFPFDNPKKNPATAFSEIEAGLGELPETTLLFLSHVESINWRIADKLGDCVLRIKHSDYHFEVLKKTGVTTTTSSHFLKFDHPVDGLDKQRIALAFALDFNPGVNRFDREKSLAKQLKIVPADPGQVAVFFPAEKETSGLRFHLHAPFVPELSRASIKETPANRPLFLQLSSLSAATLHQVRELGLLTVDFLAVLPNRRDTLPERYECIRESIIEAMNTEPLTPTYARGFAPASQLLQARVALKELLMPEDLEFLFEYDHDPYQWAVGATQKNSDIDRFLDGLDIEPWDVDKFVRLLKKKTVASRAGISSPDEDFMNWLSSKSPEWHQRLYALLFVELGQEGNFDGLKDRKIVRLSDGTYGVGNNSFFPTDNAEHDEVLPRVDARVYSSGKNKATKDNACMFLRNIGVRDVGESEQIEVLLKLRYQDGEGFRPRREDLKRFVALVENEPRRAEMFADYFIFEGKDGYWHQPSDIYLDVPFAETGLTEWYDVLGKEAGIALADWYQRAETSQKKISKFAEAVGAQTQLMPVEVRCDNNPDLLSLQSSKGGRTRSSFGIKDYTIHGIDVVLTRVSEPISRLIWKTMQEITPEYHYLKCSRERTSASSQLVHHLRNAAWIPQGNGNFVRPDEADRDLLPEGFAFDPGWTWLKAIHFGERETKRVEAQRRKQVQAEELGFADAETLDRARRFAALPTKEQERLLAEMEAKLFFELPEHKPTNPDRRAERVREMAQEAPEREYEKRSRSVALGRGEVKEDATQYLRRQYTNSDGMMICQVCKSELPFKLGDGTEYFEKVWFLAELEKQHYQNYLALCPNHAAMFQYANGSREELKGSFIALENNELSIVLARNRLSIYFTTTHIIDIRCLIDAEIVATESAKPRVSEPEPSRAQQTFSATDVLNGSAVPPRGYKRGLHVPSLLRRAIPWLFSQASRSRRPKAGDSQ